MVYTYDGLDRLSEAKRGVDGGNFYGGNQRWSLDMLGNWATFETDTTGDGDYLDANEETNRTHNDVNELTGIDTDGDEVTDLDLTFDDAGNLRERETNTGGDGYRYTHDLWNRLVKIEFKSGISYYTVGEYEYFGTHWRSVKHADSDSDLTLDEKREQYYSAGWQLLEEHVDDDYVSSPGVNRKFQYLWGGRYIDDILLHREDVNNDGDFRTLSDEHWWHLTDVQFSTVAIVDDAANLAERIQYDAYGQAIHHEWRDVDGDGDYDATDYNIIVTLAAVPGGTPITSGSYDADADLDRDGDVDSTDQTLATTNYVSALAKGELSNSTVQNTIGWDGYVFNLETEEYIVRFRWYNVELGRWIERDPIGYVDGMTLYEVTMSDPLSAIDFSGLASTAFIIGRICFRADPWDDKVPTFKGFEIPHYQKHDRLLKELVAEFNANKAEWCGCIDSTAEKIPDLTTTLVKAWIIQESGGLDRISRECWDVDPVQINVPGDWDPAKESLGLRKPKERNEGKLEDNLRAAIKALCRKGFGMTCPRFMYQWL